MNLLLPFAIYAVVYAVDSHVFPPVVGMFPGRPAYPPTRAGRRDPSIDGIDVASFDVQRIVEAR